MADHARLAPSSAHCWMHCAGSLALQSAFEDKGSGYADEGTAAHTISSWMLSKKHDLDKGFALTPAAVKLLLAHEPLVQKYCNAAMLGYCKDYCALVRKYAEGGELLVEQKVDFSPWIFGEKPLRQKVINERTGEEIESEPAVAFGTSDAVIVGSTRLTIIDLKYGMGVKVDAFENEQLMLYALGALHSFSFLGDFTEVAMVIHQPRLEHISEYVITVENLKAFVEIARLGAIAAIGQYDMWGPKARDVDPGEWTADTFPTLKLAPAEATCRWCIAKADCPALRQEVMDITAADAEDFADTPIPEGANYLADAMSKVGLVEDWCKAIRARVEIKLIANEDVPGFKLVEGKLGNRSWADAEAVEAQLKKWRLKDELVYDFSLKSPTQAEKVLPPNRWKTLQASIVRKPGKPSVAPVTDPRPAITLSATAEDFT